MEQDKVSLRDYLLAEIVNVDEKSTMRTNAIKEAVDKAEAALNLRLEAMNDVRGQLAVQRSEFATRESTDRDIDALRDRLDREGHSRDNALHTVEQRLGTFLTLDRSNALISEAQTRWEAWRVQYEKEDKARDDALNNLQQQYAGLIGRITGMGIIVVLTSLALQIVIILITHKF